jgi:gamma-glutamyltranspeptidase
MSSHETRKTRSTSGEPKDYSCAIASPHSLGTAAGQAAIEAGGNALDAALAAATVLTVVYPHNTSIGGDLFALVRDPHGRITSINASGAAGGLTNTTLLRQRHAGQMPVTGVDTITVPGAVGGLAAIHNLGAALPWEHAFTEAIGLAEEGFPIASSLGMALNEYVDLIESDGGLRTLLHSGERHLSAGDLLRNPALSASLRTLADEGPSSLYGGHLGTELIRGLQALGSSLTLNDLASYRAEIGSPLSAPFRDLQIWTSPPNSQGFLLLEILSIIEALPPGMDLLGEDSDILASIFQLATIDRGRLLADPVHFAVPIDQVLNPMYVNDAARRLASRRQLRHEPPPMASQTRPAGDTVAIVTADSDGWAVSLIQSLFHSFGSCILEPTTGIVLHNRGSFFSLDAKSPNVLAPGKRPAHTLMPAIVTRKNNLAWVMGTMGGKAQPQILTQVLLRAAGGADASLSIAEPRFIIGGLEVDQPENSAHVEPNFGPVAEVLARYGLPVTVLPQRDEVAGHAQLISLGANGELDAASDLRADGSSVVAGRGSK